jgi:AP-1 complex subunit mu
MPELKLVFNDKNLLELQNRTWVSLIVMDDIRFHECMRLNKFKSERNTSFVPPDGEFDLMTYYRVDTHVKTLIWLTV